jgi:hypothetical protein
LAQLKSGCSGANRCRYHSRRAVRGGRPGPRGPAEDRRQSFGGSRRRARPGRNQNRSRSAIPAGRERGRNQRCRSEQWFGTSR